MAKKQDYANNSVFEQLVNIADGLNFKPKGWRTISSDGATCMPDEKLIASGKTMEEAQELCRNNELLIEVIIAWHNSKINELGGSIKN